MTLSDAQQRLAEDIGMAMRQDEDAAAIMLDQAEKWSEQMKLIKAGQYQSAIALIDQGITMIQEHLAENPGIRDLMGFTLARLYTIKGYCLGGLGHQSKNVDMVKQGLQWMDQGLEMTRWPPEFGSNAHGMRAVLVKDIQGMEGQPSSADAGSPSAQHRTQQFTNIQVICPQCGKTSALEISGKCKVCTYDLELFESGAGLWCVKCGVGFHANTNGKGGGVLHCNYRSLNGFECHAPIPATPEFVTPKPSSCFIATATYGSPLAPEVEILRMFRERNLRPSVPGQKFIAFYEKYSPPFANWLVHQPLARLAIRQLLLAPIIRALKRTIKF